MNTTTKNSQNPEKTQMPIDWWNDKQKCEFPYNTVLIKNKEEWTTDTWYKVDEISKNIMLSKRSQTQKATNCMIPFI